MAVTPKGYTQIANDGPMQGPEQINDAELFVENLIGEYVANVAALPASGNWPGRTVSAGGLLRTSDGSGWPLGAGRRLGSNRNNSANTLPANPAWMDLCTVTATTAGGLCAAGWAIHALNGNSGAARTMTVRVVCDGVQVDDAITYDLPLSDTNGRSAAYNVESTPGAASHVWKLQAYASANPTVIVQHAVLTVTEY